MFKDDTRNTHPKFVANATYNFSSGESKSRSNINLTLNAKKNGEIYFFLLVEASISNMAGEKAGVSARVVTLQDQPYPDNFDFTTLDKAFRENYGTLGIAFIKQYESKQETYKSAFDSYQRYFNRKGSNEIMQRLGRAFIATGYWRNTKMILMDLNTIILKLLNKPMTVWLEIIKR